MSADQSSKGPKLVKSSNPRGIPSAPFVDNVTDYVSSREEVEPTLRSFQEMISKYQFMELNTKKRAEGLEDKIPEMKKTLETVQFLSARRKAGAEKPLETTFELNDTLYTRATVSPEDTDEVYIWLGANVMLSYPIDEAEELLKNKLAAAETSLKNCEEDLEFMREQITTLEVATARVYNWDVVQKRKDKAEGKTDESEKEKSSK
ncbi:prefoldin subunit 3 [Ascosphaera apis ARSEF 7405]|uniref:Prefoldin subunit 3 n=1 Tax=Ascosphaera apis ARSEF 7405 TaxID=392613 RepID=A0A162IFI7_9EURO|nr:prefoldin subunit 3 [Ascosphaera apis ARSEF 7405]